jgi:DNA-binding transcriptional LysR family regulator
VLELRIGKPCQDFHRKGAQDNSKYPAPYIAFNAPSLSSCRDVSYVRLGRTSSLQYLLVILEKQGFRIAAEELHTSQPNLTVQARQFQENVRSTLSEDEERAYPAHRNGNRIHRLGWTSFGARDDVINALIKRSSAGRSAHYDLGVHHCLIRPYFAASAPCIKRFCQNCPIPPTHGDTAQLAEEILAGVVDAAIVTPPLKHPDLHIGELRRDRLVVFLRRDHALASKTVLQTADLQRNLTVLYHPQRLGCS